MNVTCWEDNYNVWVNPKDLTERSRIIHLLVEAGVSVYEDTVDAKDASSYWSLIIDDKDICGYNHKNINVEDVKNEVCVNDFLKIFGIDWPCYTITGEEYNQNGEKKIAVWI